jgi:hypothetical protein
MKKIIAKRITDPLSEVTHNENAKQHQGYNEQTPSQPHGAFRPDKNATKGSYPTSVKKQSAEKRSLVKNP